MIGILVSGILTLCLVMAGCGAVGEPLPPLLDIPVRTTGLSAVQRGAQILVAWPPANLTTEGVSVRAGRQGQTRVYRVVLDGLRAPDKVTAPDFASHEATRLDAGQAAFTDPVQPGWAGHTVVYAIQMTNLRGETAGYSNVASVAVLETPPAPSLRYRLKEEAVVIEWDPQQGASYHVYRDGQLLDTVSGGVYEDHAFEFDRLYRYMVRGVARQDAVTSESADSTTLSVTPVDTFAPKTPTGLRAVRLEDTVELSWTANTENDFAGYIVYRNGTRVSPTLLAAPVFRDTAPGPSPRYTVKAVDRKGNESPASQEAIP